MLAMEAAGHVGNRRADPGWSWRSWVCSWEAIQAVHHPENSPNSTVPRPSCNSGEGVRGRRGAGAGGRGVGGMQAEGARKMVPMGYLVQLRKGLG